MFFSPLHQIGYENVNPYDMKKGGLFPQKKRELIKARSFF